MGPLSTSLRAARWVARVVGITLVPVALWVLLMPSAFEVITTTGRAPLHGVDDASFAVAGVTNAPTDRDVRTGPRLAASPVPSADTPIESETPAAASAALPPETAATATVSAQALPAALVNQSQPSAARWARPGSTPAPTLLAASLPRAQTAALTDAEIGPPAEQPPAKTMTTLITVVGVLIGAGSGLTTYAAVRLLRTSPT
jgi:hypothetical protein